MQRMSWPTLATYLWELVSPGVVWRGRFHSAFPGVTEKISPLCSCSECEPGSSPFAGWSLRFRDKIWTHFERLNLW